jgi:hypothetical protein
MYKVVEMGGSVASTNKCWAFAVSGSQDRDRHIIFIPHPSPIIQLRKKLTLPVSEILHCQ